MNETLDDILSILLLPVFAVKGNSAYESLDNLIYESESNYVCALRCYE